MPTVDLNKLTAIVHKSQRPSDLRRLVKSLRKFYPQLRLIVADDGPDSRPLSGVDTLNLPVDSGRAACRNALLARVRTPYFLLLDETAELSRESELEQLLQLVVDDKLDIAAGDTIECSKRFFFFTRRRPTPQHGLCDFSGSSLKLRHGTRTKGEGYWWCDLVGDFYVARTNKVRTIGGWDSELFDNEREEFFVRAHRQGLRVGLAPDVAIWQWALTGEQNGTAAGISDLAVAKMGLERVTDFAGNTTKAPRRAQAA